MRSRRTAVLTCALLAACSPALDWRDVRTGAGQDAAELQLLMPCKPQRETRALLLHNTQTSFTLTACAAGGMMFSIGAADIKDATQVTPTLVWMRNRLAANIAAMGSSNSPAVSFVPKGATPNAEAKRLLLQGKRPDGQDLIEHAAVFTQGTRVYQAVVTAPLARFNRDAAEQFFGSIAMPQ
jgi:hypothetical protein